MLRRSAWAVAARREGTHTPSVLTDQTRTQAVKKSALSLPIRRWRATFPAARGSAPVLARHLPRYGGSEPVLARHLFRYAGKWTSGSFGPLRSQPRGNSGTMRNIQAVGNGVPASLNSGK